MLKTDWISTDKISLANYNLIWQTLSDAVNIKIGQPLIYFTKSTGNFLFSEDLQLLEAIIEFMAIRCDIQFDKKDWNNLTGFDYININRLSLAINDIVNSVVFNNIYIYASDTLYASDYLFVI